MRSKTSRSTLRAIQAVTFLIVALATDRTPVFAGGEPPLAGHWEGALVLTPAEQEIDVVVDFRLVARELRGDVAFPITGDGRHPVENFSRNASAVFFSVRDKDGVVSAFEGVLSPDGKTLAGTMKEGKSSMPFVLHRGQARKAREPVRQRIGGDGILLKEAFNADRGKTRLLALMNLGTFSSRIALRIIERYVLERIDSSDLAVYVVWVVPDRQGVEEVLRQDTSLAADPRVTHFWTTDRSLLAVLDPILTPYKPLTNPCLLFAPDRSWGADAPPPDRFRQSPKVGQTKPVEAGRKLNGLDLEADVRLLLASKRGAPASP